MGQTVYEFNPLRNARWPAFLARHPQASVFHTLEWLEALRRTYGYEPVVFTTSPPGEELRNGIVFCRVKSWLTGCRTVSLPFSDHCRPLVENAQDFAALVSFLKESLAREKWKYFEIRPAALSAGDLEIQTRLAKGEEFYFHALDLRPSLDTLFRNFHKSCVQRKIHRAEREKLAYEEGRSESLLAKFYALMLLTRRRHQLPPQPLNWFRNLISCLGDRLKIRVASKGGQPVASILTLRHKRALVYKYGCSDARFHSSGGMPYLFWKAIQEGKETGAEEFDLGRSEVDNEGLISFKGHLGAACSTLTYSRYPAPQADKSHAEWKMRLVQNVFSRLPDSLLAAAGRVLYRHVG